GKALFFVDSTGFVGADGGARIGLAPSIDGVDPKTLARDQLAAGDLGIAAGLDVRFWTYPTRAPLLLWSSVPTSGDGIDLYGLELDGTVRIRQKASGPKPLLPPSPAPIVATSVVSISAPTTFADLPMVWITQANDAGTKTDTIHYGKISCQ